MLLGIDWGQKKIGLAVAEEEIAIASAFGVVQNDNNVFDNLQKIVVENDVSVIIIGKSAHLSQTDNTQKIEKFGKTCGNRLGVEIRYIDEMFSTREAHVNLKTAGHKKIDTIDDAESARIILQQFLDM